MIDRIVDALALMNTDKREDSLKSIIKYVLFSVNEECSINELIQYLNLEFEITFQDDEIKQNILSLISNQALIQENERLRLSESTFKEIEFKRAENDRIKEKSFVSFQSSIAKFSRRELPIDEKRELFEVFLGYLNECFYSYGKSAIDLFKPNFVDEDEDSKSRKKILNNALNKIPTKELQFTLESYIKVFPNLLTEDEEIYLERLADKTEYFFALGLPEEIFNEIQKLNPINLVLYLDTNVLLSVLNLRNHTSNEACQKLIKLIRENNDTLNIQVHYTSSTYNELKTTRNEIGNLVNKLDLEPKIAEAGLASQKLDSFTSVYYDEYLKYGTSVKHPIEKLKNLKTNFQAIINIKKLKMKPVQKNILLQNGKKIYTI